MYACDQSTELIVPIMDCKQSRLLSEGIATRMSAKQNSKNYSSRQAEAIHSQPPTRSPVFTMVEEHRKTLDKA